MSSLPNIRNSTDLAWEREVRAAALYWNSLSTSEKVRHLTGQFKDPTLNVRLNTHVLNQREVDERQARQKFENAVEWIEWTDLTKGKLSGKRFEAVLDTPKGRHRVLYVQTRDYHMTGGEAAIQQNRDACVYEEVTVVGETAFSFHFDTHRADSLKSELRLLRAEEEQQKIPSEASQLHMHHMSVLQEHSVAVAEGRHSKILPRRHSSDPCHPSREGAHRIGERGSESERQQNFAKGAPQQPQRYSHFHVTQASSLPRSTSKYLNGRPPAPRFPPGLHPRRGDVNWSSIMAGQERCDFRSHR